MKTIKGIIFLIIGIILLLLPIMAGGWFLILWIFPTFFFVAAHGYLTGEFFKNK